MAFRDSINDLMYRFYERFKQNNNRLPVSVEADLNFGDVEIGTVKQGAKDDGAEPWDVALQGMDDPEDPVEGTLLGRLSALEEKMDALLSDGLQLKGQIVPLRTLGRKSRITLTSEPWFPTLPTEDGSGQTVHPRMVYIPQGWNGYKYWLAY